MMGGEWNLFIIVLNEVFLLPVLNILVLLTYIYYFKIITDIDYICITIWYLLSSCMLYRSQFLYTVRVE